MRDQILRDIKAIRDQDSRIRFNPTIATHLAKKWLCEPFNLPTWDTPIIMDNNLTLASAYFFFGNAINFGFYPGEDIPGPAGNINFWLTLRSRPDFLSPAFLSKVTNSDLEKTFGKLSFPDLRAEILRTTARALRLKYNGSVTDFYEAHQWNAPEIVKAIPKDFPAFADINHGVSFLRRAQLTLFMTHARFQDSMLFTNLNRLTVAADVQVFNGLLNLGVLELDPEIAHSLKSHTIACDPDFEFQIRCNTIIASENLLSNINALRKDPISPCQLDYLLRQTGTNGKIPLPLSLCPAF